MPPSGPSLPPAQAGLEAEYREHLEREHGIRQIYLKFEGGNPTGTQKDRIAFKQCHDALRRGYETVTLASCGNYGAAMALASRLAARGIGKAR